MPSTAETGHAKNVTNFKTLITICKSYGKEYNPSKVGITLEGLNAIRTQAASDLTDMKKMETAAKKAINARKLAFENVKPLSTRIVNALAASDADDLVTANARTINRKIQGARATPIKKNPLLTDGTTAEAPVSKTISTSQQSFDGKVDNFEKLLETVTQEDGYKPNEADLQVVSLQAKLALMTQTNSDFVDFNTDLVNMRIQRDDTLYSPTTGLYKTAIDVKTYLLSVYTASGPKYRKVSGIKFTDMLSK